MAPTKTSRSRLRSSATEPYSLDQCNEIINSQFRRPRHPSAPGGGEGRSTPADDPTDRRRNTSDSKWPTLKIIVKRKIEIEELITINRDDLPTENQVYGSNNGYRSQDNSHTGYQENYYNRRRGDLHNYKNNKMPINQDERTNLQYNYYGNPIDTSQDPDATFAVHHPSLEGNREYSKGQGFNTGLQRGHNREQEYSRVPREHSHQSNGPSQRKGAQYDPKDNTTNQGPRRYCMVCKEQGHNSLLHCSKLPQYIPIGNNFKPKPKGLCQICLSTAVYSKYCTHIYPKDYSNWLCQKSKINFILCRNCDEHLPSQNWLKEKFKPHIGHRNLSNIWKIFKNDLIN